MDFKAFDRSKLDEYSRQAKELYGNTPEYKEMQEKTKNRTKEEDNLLADRLMLLFREAGEIRNTDPASPEAQNIVKRIMCYDTTLQCVEAVYMDIANRITVHRDIQTAEYRSSSFQGIVS